MPCRTDFHTHSVASPDGSLTLEAYERMLQHGLDCIAITDHNTINLALEAKESLGERIIVGEEITTTRGEIIGLFLKEVVAPGLSPDETIKRIHDQGGLVYIPHPFETVRKGLSHADLDEIADEVDIIEVHNGRAVFQNKSKEAAEWAKAHKVAGAASSDSHGVAGWGRTYTILMDATAPPTRENLVEMLGFTLYRTGKPGIRGMLYPKFNRLRKRKRS
jgi:predicted metal-dependent phosphoesterase TrpH